MRLLCANCGLPYDAPLNAKGQPELSPMTVNVIRGEETKITAWCPDCSALIQ